MDAALIYNANQYTVSARYLSNSDSFLYFWNTISGSGWQANTPYSYPLGLEYICDYPDQNNQTKAFTTTYTYVDAEQTRHPIAFQKPSGATTCSNAGPDIGPDLTAQGVSYGVSGAGFQLANGAKSLGTTTTDPNGNSTQSLYEMNSAGSGGDSLGRTIYTVTPSNYVTPQSYPGDNFLVAGQVPTTVTYSTHNSVGSQITYTLNYIVTTVNTAFNVGALEITSHPYQLGSVVLPNGQQYSFEYESTFGMLSAVHLPTGTVIRYTYGVYDDPAPPSEDQQVTRLYVQSRTQTLPDGTSSTWNLNIVTPPGQYQSTTQVTFPTMTGGVREQATFFPSGGTVTDAKYYAGTASGTPIREYKIQYQWNQDPTVDSCFYEYSEEATPPLGQSLGLLPTLVTTILEDGATQYQTAYTYDTLSYTYHPNHCEEGPQPGQTFTASRGNVKTIKQYDFNGALLREVDKTYLHEAGTNAAQYVAANIVDKVISDIVKDGSGNRVAETDYTFDDYSSQDGSGLSSIVGAPGHDDVNYSTSNVLRGNVTQVRRWLNTGPGSYLTTSYAYDSLGNILSIRDPLGNLTTWSLHR